MAKPKSKTQKKIDNHVRLVLHDACEHFLAGTPGFQWLTHEANYSSFPASLVITCVFDTQGSWQQACQNGDSSNMQKHIQAKLLKIGIKLKTPKQQVVFKSEKTPS